MKMRVMTFNIQHGFDHVKKVMNLELMAEVMKKIDADVICVNEVRGEGAYPDEPAILTSLTGMNGVFGVSLVDSRGEYGNMLLSKYPILSSVAIPIPLTDERPGSRLYEPRVIIKAELDVKPIVTVIATHFGLNDDEQERIVSKACELIDNCENPVIMMGDFNATPDNPVLLPLFERLSDAAKKFCPDKKSYDSINPEIKIDYILTSRDIKVNFADIPEIIASDHRPHYADIEI